MTKKLICLTSKIEVRYTAHSKDAVVERANEMHSFIYASIYVSEAWQLEFRKIASSWFIAIAVSVTYLLTAKYKYLSLPPSSGVFLVSWGGIVGLLPAYFLDLRHFELMRKAFQREAEALEASFSWMKSLNPNVSANIPGVVTSSVGRFYSSCLAILLLIAGGAAFWANSSIGGGHGSLWLGLHIVTVGFVLTGSSWLLRYNGCVLREFVPGSYFTGDISEAEWMQVWPQYQVSMTHFNQLLLKLIQVRRFAALSFMYTFTAISLIVSVSDRAFALDWYCAVMATCGIGASLIMLFWSVEVYGYQKHVMSVSQALSSLETRYSFLPQFASHLLTILKFQKMPTAAIMYCGHIQILIAVAVTAWILSPNSDLGLWPKVLSGLALVFLSSGAIIWQSYSQTIFRESRASKD